MFDVVCYHVGMSERADGETNDQLIEAAAAGGYTVTKRQLAEWHRAGLLPPPQQVFGEHAGSMSLYPVGTTDRLLALCAVRKQWRRNADVAWGLWWAGYDVSEGYVREPLQRVAADWGRGMQQLRELLGRTAATQSNETDSDALSDAFFEFIDQAASSRISKAAIAQARKRVGRERFPTFVRVIIEVVTGTFTGYTVDAVTDTKDEERQLIEVALGVARGRTDRLADAEPWLTTDTEDALREISRLVQQYPPGYGLDTVTLQELARTRDEVKVFFAMLTGWSEASEQMFGRGAFGLAGFRAITNAERPNDQALWVLLWRTLRMAGLGPAMDMLLPVARHWQQTVQPMIVATQQLRTEVPATGELLDPKQIGRGLKSKREEKRRLDAIRALRPEHAEELDAFFAKHPEVQTAETAETVDTGGNPDATATPVDDHPQHREPDRSSPQAKPPRTGGET